MSVSAQDRLKPPPPERAVALIMAGGGRSSGTEKAPGSPLTPILGKPVAGYVLSALTQSKVERVFIVHDPSVDLKKALGDHPKAVFTPVTSGSSLCASILTGITILAKSYTPDELRNLRILGAPCDMPLAAPRHFNLLLESSLNIEEDVFVPYTNQSLLNETFPGKRFMSFYLTDKKGRYTPQSVWIVRGRPLADALDKGWVTVNPRGELDILDKRLLRLYNLFDSLVNRRKSRLNAFYLLFSFTLRMALSGHFSCFWRLFISSLKKRYTLSQAEEVLYHLTGLTFTFGENRLADLSGDADTPGDLEHISHILKSREQPDHDSNLSASKEQL
jgi:GTP:adenosylcobinamide-phosphate guanylyltransferase